MGRLAAKTLGALALLLLAAALSSYVYLRQSLPQMDGSVTVAGLSVAVTVERDARGIPHVQAANRRDAFFGLGYVHAQDRLWQMEFQRRIARGTLSEIFGPQTLAQDRFLRTLGTGRAADAAWTRLPDDARVDIEAYVAGVNAFIETHRGSRLPPEFTILRVQPAPWTGSDVIGWVKMMAWDLSANYSAELLRHDLSTRLGTDRAEMLMPAPEADSLAIVADAVVAIPESEPAVHPTASGQQRSSAPSAWSTTLADGLSRGHPSVRDLLLGGARTEALGSNSWVAAGSRTASEFPLLANDPHLGTRIPSVWYLARLTGGDEIDVVGATLPGAPGVALGRNRFIAWGLTNVAADVQDIFLERLDATGKNFEYQGRLEPLRVIRDVIRVRGGDPVPLQIRMTRHGPIISDAINANAAASAGGQQARAPLPPLSLRWTALDDDDTTIAAFLRVNQASNWREFTDALRLFIVPSQNFVYADRDGHIGYYAPGRIPVRARGDGRWPAEGWSAEMEWIGAVPFDELPHAFDPPQGIIVTANNRPAGVGYRHLIGTDFPEPYRAQRIHDLLASRQHLTPDHFAAMQADTLSLHARDLLPKLLRHVRPENGAERAAIERLSAWNMEASGASADAALFEAWFLALAPAIAGDELGPDLLRAYEGRFSFVTRFIARTLERDTFRWCDDTRTPASETCDEAVTSAFRTALGRVTETMGDDSGEWRWERMHRVVFPHQGLDGVRGLRTLLSRRLPGHGDWSTVNVGPVTTDGAFDQRSVSSYRQIVDLSPADDSRFTDAVGQSGHFLSPHYDDALSDWRAVRYRPMESKDGDSRRILRLLPAGDR